MLGKDERPDDRMQVRQQPYGLHLTGKYVNSCQEMFPGSICSVTCICSTRGDD